MTSECLKWFSLFPGPLKVICEDPEIQSFEDVIRMVDSSCCTKYTLFYVKRWFERWQTRGYFLVCVAPEQSLQWLCWDFKDCCSVHNLIEICSRKNSWNMLNWCWSVQPDKFDMGPALMRYVLKNNLPAAQWVHARGSTCHWDDAVFICCQDGYVDMAKWLCQVGTVHIKQHGADWMKMTCRFGHATVAQWLCELGWVPLQDWFVEACGRGQLEMSQWLWQYFQSQSTHHLHDLMQKGFEASATNNNLSVAQWLWQTSLQSSGQIPFQTLDRCFETVCKMGFVTMAKWLNSLDSRLYYVALGYEMSVSE